MSQHTSLKVKSVGAAHRNVLKRYERIGKLKEDVRWEGRKRALGLPKVKSIKIKVKKTKSEAAAEVKSAAEAASVAAPKPAGTA